MLKIGVDLFSGRPNPEWIITDAETTDSLLDAVARTPEVAAAPGTGYQGLGFREVLVSYLADDPERKARPRVANSRWARRPAAISRPRPSLP